MSIWHFPLSLEGLNALSHDTVVEKLGIEFIEIGDDYLRATMPVDGRTVQPMRLLHGGASVVLAETLGSVAATFCADPSTKSCVGLEINANHVRAVPENATDTGRVTGTVTPIHVGQRTQIWQIRIVDDRERLACIARITMAVLDR